MNKDSNESLLQKWQNRRRMPTSARTSLGFFGQSADVGIRAPEQSGLLQQARTNPLSSRWGRRGSNPTVVRGDFLDAQLRLEAFMVWMNFAARRRDRLHRCRGAATIRD